jgi:putative membrane protein
MGLSKYTTLTLGLVLAATTVVAAQSTPELAPGSPPHAPKAALPTAPAEITMTVQESEVIDQLHAANVLEIAAGKLAQRHAGSADVKRYGEHLVQDHTKADRELTAFAKRTGVKLAVVDSAKLDALKALRGKDFDRAFLGMMVKDHQSAIELVRTAQPRATNYDVRAILDKTLPTLEHHSQTARQLSGGSS